MLTRRTVLMTSAAIPLAGCVTNATTGAVTLSPAINDFIINAVGAIAHYAPSVESIAAVAAGLFGPQYAAIVQFGSQALNNLITVLQNLVKPPATPTPAQRRLAGRLKAMAAGSDVIGYAVTPQGKIPVVGRAF